MFQTGEEGHMLVILVENIEIAKMGPQEIKHTRYKTKIRKTGLIAD